MTFTLLVLHQTVRPAGLAEAHFAWPAPRPIRALRRHLTWIIPVVLPLAVVVTAVELIPEDERIDKSLGRFASMASLAGHHRVLRRRASPRRRRASVITSCVNVTAGWLDCAGSGTPVLVAGPLVLTMLAWIGYYFTALNLDDDIRTPANDWSVILILVYALFRRLLLVSHRRLAARLAERQRAAEGESEEIPGGRPAGGPTLDLPAVAARAKRLVQSGVLVALLVGLLLHVGRRAARAAGAASGSTCGPIIQVVEARPGHHGGSPTTGRPRPTGELDQPPRTVARPANEMVAARAHSLVTTPAQLLPQAEPDRGRDRMTS